MLSNYITMHGAKNMRMKASPTQSLGLYELKQHKPWFHEEYLQPLVQRKQDKIQRVIWLQTPTVFWLCSRTISLSYLVYMGLAILGRQKYIQHSQ